MANFFNTYGSLTDNGVLAPVYERSALSPSQAPQPYYQGTGQRFNTLSGGSSVLSSVYDELGDSTIYGDSSDAANLQAADEAAADPFNAQKSPVLWAIIFLVVGLLGLRYVHWRG